MGPSYLTFVIFKINTITCNKLLLFCRLVWPRPVPGEGHYGHDAGGFTGSRDVGRVAYAHTAGRVQLRRLRLPSRVVEQHDVRPARRE